MKNNKINIYKILIVIISFVIFNQLLPFEKSLNFTLCTSLFILIVLYIFLKKYSFFFDKETVLSIEKKDIMKFYLIVYFIPVMIVIILMFFINRDLPEEQLLIDHKQINIYLIIRMCFVAPILEEIFFRKLILDEYINKDKIIGGIVISSLIFAILHLDPVFLFIYFLIGVAYANLYIKTKSILITIILHSLNNLGVLLMKYNLFGGLGYIVFLFSPLIVLGAICKYRIEMEKKSQEVVNES